jgi:hypothetical protein
MWFKNGMMPAWSLLSLSVSLSLQKQRDQFAPNSLPSRAHIASAND